MAKPTVEDEVFLREMATAAAPVVTAVELADDVGLSQQAAYQRLRRLEDEGKVRSKKVGPKARVWWLTDLGRQCLN